LKVQLVNILLIPTSNKHQVEYVGYGFKAHARELKPSWASKRVAARASA
jgi:hypothetical protein